MHALSSSRHSAIGRCRWCTTPQLHSEDDAVTPPLEYISPQIGLLIYMAHSLGLGAALLRAPRRSPLPVAAAQLRCGTSVPISPFAALGTRSRPRALQLRAFSVRVFATGASIAVETLRKRIATLQVEQEDVQKEARECVESVRSLADSLDQLKASTQTVRDSCKDGNI